LGIPFYALRRLTDVSDFFGRICERKPDAHPVHRSLLNLELAQHA
jgi:hypothetical protein